MKKLIFILLAFAGIACAEPSSWMTPDVAYAWQFTTAQVMQEPIVNTEGTVAANPIVLESHGTANNGGAGAATTPAMDCHLSNFAIIVGTNYGGSNIASSSPSETWTNLPVIGGAGTGVVISYAYNVSNFTSSTTFTYTAGTPSIFAACFENVATVSPSDQIAAGGDAASGVCQAGSITPAVNGELIIASMGYGGSSISIGSSYTLTDQSNTSGGSYMGGALAYLVQNTAGATNPSWTTNSGAASPCGVASFKP